MWMQLWTKLIYFKQKFKKQIFNIPIKVSQFQKSIHKVNILYIMFG